MDSIFKYLIIFANFFRLFASIYGDTYNVKIAIEQHVNLVDSKFLSFTIDPKLFFNIGEKYTKHCTCMATSLTPAYIRIAGPSTTRLIFQNSSISIDDSLKLDRHSLSLLSNEKNYRLSITHKQWENFFRWAKRTGFDLVFALNNEEKTTSGMWDANAALYVLTMAEKANVGDMFWQLGYACMNQSIEEYLNDLETLRVIMETFPSGQSKSWRVVGGDVTPCLQADSKSDFKDYVTLSNDMMDAILLNGNSSAQELERMSESDRLKLLKLLSHSDTPLWLTEVVQQKYNELERAADWLTSLGYSARNGFSVHFRELLEEELHEPTLSFYMALLFKNLVGERVLNVDIKASQATLFAHCTSLRHKPVPGALTLYGANMDDETARFSLKLSKREQGGDIMQFILGHDNSGNIMVNGRAMYLEGDIRPVVKRVRPYKTLLINLPAKTFGFWVLANTQVDACRFSEENQTETQIFKAVPIDVDFAEEESSIKTKRSSLQKRDVADFDQSIDLSESYFDTSAQHTEKSVENNPLKQRIENFNMELKHFHELLNAKTKLHRNYEIPMRLKRQTFDSDIKKKMKKTSMKSRMNKNKYEQDIGFKSNLIDKILQFKNEKLSKLGKVRLGKNVKRSDTNVWSEEVEKSGNVKISRKQRSVINEKILHNKKDLIFLKNRTKTQKTMEDNEVDVDGDQFGVNDMLYKLKGTLRQLPLEVQEIDERTENIKDLSDTNEITLKTKWVDDGAIIDISEKSNHGLIRETLDELVSLLADLNVQLNRFWNTFTFLE